MVRPADCARAIRVSLRLCGVAAMLLAAALLVAGVFPFCAAPRRARLRARWSAGVLRVLGVGLRVRGPRPAPGSLVVSNHVSWLDVLAINAIAPASFVCKSEVRAWPLIGWLAERNDTVFVRRGSAMQARRVNAELSRRLARGTTVAVFPEGTTSDGRGLLGFRPATLQAALDAGAPVQPIALRYLDARGRLCAAAPYVGSTSFVASMLAVAASSGTVAHLDAAPCLDGEDADRRLLAHSARRRIGALLRSRPAAGAMPRSATPAREYS